jgi:hypothetical protein
VFCSRECNARYRDYKENAGTKSGGGGGLLVKIIILVLIIAAAFLAWRQGLIPGVPAPGAPADAPAEDAAE